MGSVMGPVMGYYGLMVCGDGVCDGHIWADGLWSWGLLQVRCSGMTDMAMSLERGAISWYRPLKGKAAALCLDTLEELRWKSTKP